MDYVIACPDCAAIQEKPRVATGRLHCWQCQAVLERSRGRPLGSALACALTTLVLLVPANLMLLIRISKDVGGGGGRVAAANLWFLAGCVLPTSIAIPFVELAGIVWLVVSVRTRSRKHLVLKTRLFRVSASATRRCSPSRC